MRYALLSTTTICLVALAMTGCNNLSQFSALNTNRLVWEALQLYHYRYTLQVSCFCVPEFTDPVIVEVKNGVPISLEYAKGDTPEAGLFDDFDTIDELFDIVENALGENAVVVEADYDAVRGYPVDVYIDYEANIADEEIGFTVSNLEEL